MADDTKAVEDKTLAEKSTSDAKAPPVGWLEAAWGDEAKKKELLEFIKLHGEPAGAKALKQEIAVLNKRLKDSAGEEQLKEQWLDYYKERLGADFEEDIAEDDTAATVRRIGNAALKRQATPPRGKGEVEKPADMEAAISAFFAKQREANLAPAGGGGIAPEPTLAAAVRVYETANESRDPRQIESAISNLQKVRANSR